jgi:hypothetical protein
MEIYRLHYGLHITDDPLFPEVEILIMGSPGQSGHCSLVIVLMAVDGGIHGLPAVITHIPYGKVLNKDIPPEILKGLRKIRKKFTKDSTFLTVDHMNLIIRAWDRMWEA